MVQQCQAIKFLEWHMLPYDVLVEICKQLVQRCEFGPRVGSVSKIFAAALKDTMSGVTMHEIRAAGACLYLATGEPLDARVVEKEMDRSVLIGVGGGDELPIILQQQQLTVSQPGMPLPCKILEEDLDPPPALGVPGVLHVSAEKRFQILKPFLGGHVQYPGDPQCSCRAS